MKSRDVPARLEHSCRWFYIRVYSPGKSFIEHDFDETNMAAQLENASPRNYHGRQHSRKNIDGPAEPAMGLALRQPLLAPS